MSPLASLQLDNAPGATTPEGSGRGGGRMHELLGRGNGGSLNFGSGGRDHQQRQFHGGMHCQMGVSGMIKVLSTHRRSGRRSTRQLSLVGS